MPARYEKLGICFEYPENWTLDEKEALEGQESVTVYSPGGGFWSITLHPPDVNPQELVDAALVAMRQVYQDLDAEPVIEQVGPLEMVGCDMNFYCLDLTNTAMVRGFSTPLATLLVFFEAEDREFEQIEPVFRAMTRSLLQSETE